MDTGVMFVDCPAYMDKTGAARCGLPAAVEYRYTVRSSDGPLESVKIRCPRGHWFNGPLESMLWDKATSRKQDVKDIQDVRRRWLAGARAEHARSTHGARAEHTGHHVRLTPVRVAAADSPGRGSLAL